jgi:transposase-like protein
VATVQAGTSISQAARQFGLDKSVVSRWVATRARTHPVEATHPPTPDLATIERYVREALRAMAKQRLLRPRHVPMETYHAGTTNGST